MKKPKKTTAAAPRTSRRLPGTKLSAGTLENKTEVPKKSSVKRARKTAASTPDIAPGTLTNDPAEVNPQPQPSLPVKPKRTRVKTAAKTSLPVDASTASTPKPASLAGLVAEGSSSEKASGQAVVAEFKKANRPVRPAPSKIPPILLEGDKPTAPPVSGPGERYALGPTAPVEKLQTEGELPASYETGEILLSARDPYWLYTHWDLSDTQQRRYNAFSRDGHLIVRVYIDVPTGKPAAEVHVHPDSRHWFIHVNQANTRYVAELGYYSAADRWTVVSTSTATLTPPDAVSAETSAEFATIPLEVPMHKLLSLVKEAVHESVPLAQAVQELRAEGHRDLPRIEIPRVESPKNGRTQTHSSGRQTIIKKSSAPWKPSAWTAAQERALAEVISMDHVRRVWMGSLEITELIRRRVVREVPSGAAAEQGGGAPTSPMGGIGGVSGISSPSAKAAQPPKGFWFNVNAELIVYGATEADATVTIAGRKIKLRPDGSFSYRFALPDGNYEMPIVAISADQTDGRAAEMKFSRSTEYRGHVGAHPQDPSLQQLRLENF